jgi:hypothetical protein
MWMILGQGPLKLTSRWEQRTKSRWIRWITFKYYKRNPPWSYKTTNVAATSNEGFSTLYRLLRPKTSTHIETSSPSEGCVHRRTVWIAQLPYWSRDFSNHRQCIHSLLTYIITLGWESRRQLYKSGPEIHPCAVIYLSPIYPRGTSPESRLVQCLKDGGDGIFPTLALVMIIRHWSTPDHRMIPVIWSTCTGIDDSIAN